MVSYGDVESKTRYPAMPTKVARKAKIGKCHEAWVKEEPQTPCQLLIIEEPARLNPINKSLLRYMV